MSKLLRSAVVVLFGMFSALPSSAQQVQIERYRRQAEILDKKAKVVTEQIRKRRRHGKGAAPEAWFEDRDGLRDDAQLFRIDAREAERVLSLVRRGRFVAAKAVILRSLGA